MVSSLAYSIRGGLILSRKVDGEIEISQRQQNQKLVKLLLARPWHWLTVGLGTGLLPWVPGTWGTLPGILLILAVSRFNLLVYVSIALVATLVGIWLSADLSDRLHKHDPSVVVWDEIVGLLWAMAGVPLTWYWIVTGFVVFRLLDGIKPWPISLIDQNLSGGQGIMLDDVAAGILTMAIMHLMMVTVWYVA